MFIFFQVLFSRYASPHVNIALDSNPVSASVVLPRTPQSQGAVLMATGNKVGGGHRLTRVSVELE